MIGKGLRRHPGKLIGAAGTVLIAVILLLWRQLKSPSFPEGVDAYRAVQRVLRGRERKIVVAPNVTGRDYGLMAGPVPKELVGDLFALLQQSIASALPKKMPRLTQTGEITVVGRQMDNAYAGVTLISTNGQARLVLFEDYFSVFPPQSSRVRYLVHCPGILARFPRGTPPPSTPRRERYSF